MAKIAPQIKEGIHALSKNELEKLVFDQVCAEGSFCLAARFIWYLLYGL